MLLEHEFTVPVPAGEAWALLLDAERSVPCLPGATLAAVSGRGVEGKLRVRVGPVTVTYTGGAGVTELDPDARRALVTARGREARGDGTVEARIDARVRDTPGGARVTVTADLTVTGRLASTGENVLADAGRRLLDRFAGRLVEGLTAAGEPAPAPAPAAAPNPGSPDAAPAGPADAPALTPELAPEPPVSPADGPDAAADGVPLSAPAPVRPPAAARPAHAASPVASFVDYPATRRAPALRRAAPVLALLMVLVLLIRRHRRR